MPYYNKMMMMMMMMMMIYLAPPISVLKSRNFLTYVQDRKNAMNVH